MGLRRAAIVLLGLACTPAAQAPTTPKALGWVTTVIEEPEAFQEVMERTDREGWIALHAHDYLTAYRRFAVESGDAARIAEQRAAQAELLLQQDLQRLTGHAARKLFAAWEARGELPEGAAPVRALAERCSGGSHQAAEPWGALSGEGLPTQSQVDSLAEGPLKERLQAHLLVIEGAPPTALQRAATRPMLKIQDQDFERAWFDPCVHATLAHHMGRSLGPEPSKALAGWRGLEASLFSGWLDPSDLRGQLQAGPTPSGTSADLHDALGLSIVPASTDDAQPALEEAREATRRLDDLRASALRGASADRASLVQDLGVIERFRTEMLVNRSRADLLGDRPRRAQATLTLVRDVTERGISPLNSPSLFVLLAEANLRTGRTREALDALQPLSTARPETVGVREFIGDLSVLQGLDRDGDSKEL